MQNYTDNIKYLDSELSFGEICKPEFYDRLKIDPAHPIYKETDNFTQEKFKYPYLPLHLMKYSIPNIENIETNVLRLLIRDNNENNNIYIPKELLVLKDFILENINYHRQHFSFNKNAFIYITVRQSTYNELFYKEAFDWHIDGFQGSRIERHIVEQNVFWCNKSPTQYLLQPMYCEGLNPSKYDINDFFNKNADEKYLFNSEENSIYYTNPYNIHKVNSLKFKGKRIFVRLNFSPVEIEDPTNTINPMLPRYYQERKDLRNFLSEYLINEKKHSGFHEKSAEIE